MKERPILMQGEMVQRTLDGSKGQTRRVVKLWEAPNGWGVYHSDGADDWEFVHLGEDGDPYPDGGMVVRRCPYGVPSDRLWVREAWRVHGYSDRPDGGLVASIVYGATGTTIDISGIDDEKSHLPATDHWRPSIHMPRWASRITLEVTDVRVERIQDISGVDARAEGVKCPVVPKPDAPGYCDPLVPVELLERAHAWPKSTTGDEAHDFHSRLAFSGLWESINAKRGYGWETNPWVWCVTFKKVSD